MTHDNIGSSFDSFLEEEGLVEEVEALAFKEVLAREIKLYLLKNNMSKTHFARKMGTSRPVLNRILDCQNESLTLKTIQRASKAMEKRLVVGFM